MIEKYVVKATFDMDAAKAIDRVSNRAFRIFIYIAMPLSVLMAAAMLLVFKDQDVVFWCAFAGGIVALSILYLLVNPWLIYKNYDEKTGEVTYRFSKNSMSVSYVSGNNSVHYTDMLRLAETKDHILIYPRKRAAFALPKADFIQGNPSDFMTFIEGKTGLKARRFHA